MAKNHAISKVYASDTEWYDICKAGFERGMMGPIPEDEIFVNNLGEKVLQGAMGVDKLKEVGARSNPCTLLTG